LKILYSQGFLRTISSCQFNATEVFWQCFLRALEENPRGYDGKRRILSIIADKFSYETLHQMLKVKLSISYL